ncbi:hypothetical protein [Pseudoroseomonas ludipueritiae]|uniref:DUF2635 domain-containing protein n=1 Tax=Pseudoroseomonas ludipueritiae TaxID=198093 RepID=A0ABR7R7Z9_9PROT|nr:hypothetical protein [Pseudoroseomonas ludipueritiae]MBC9177828.1 hypothetical protein [Pseudoroseomonas ludipueritiae]MCG7363171.1 hypothetical protein [Roseomonas sp. ACRSG]
MKKPPSVTTADHHYAGHQISIRTEQRGPKRWEAHWEVATLNEKGKIEEPEPTAHEAEDVALIDARYAIRMRLEAAEGGKPGGEQDETR